MIKYYLIPLILVLLGGCKKLSYKNQYDKCMQIQDDLLFVSNAILLSSRINQDLYKRLESEYKLLYNIGDSLYTFTYNSNNDIADYYGIEIKLNKHSSECQLFLHKP